MSELTHDDVRMILKILDEIGDRDLHLEIGDLKLHATRGHAPAGTMPSSLPAGITAEMPLAPIPQIAATPALPQAKLEVPAEQVAVRAPSMGTCYRAPSPGAAPFVEIGDHVEAHDIVCVLDVMKLFSSLNAGVAGTITAVLFENEALVEKDEPLLLIRPD